MRSIKARFNQQQSNNPYWSSLTCFLEAVRGQKLSKDMISRWFYKIVSKDDYCKDEIKSILKNIYKANKEIIKNKERRSFPFKYYSK